MSARTPITIGSAVGLTPAVGATLQRNAYNIDVLSRPFTCPRDKVKQLIPSAGTPDIFYNNLYSTGNYSLVENEGLQCTVTLEYKGLLNGALPDPVISTGLSTSSTSATGGDAGPPEDQRTWDILYFSPSRTYRYVANSEPRGPRFNSYISGAMGTPSMIYQQIRDGTGRPRSSVSNISLTAIAQISGFRADQVPGSKGPLFEVEEVWSGYIHLTPTS